MSGNEYDSSDAIGKTYCCFFSFITIKNLFFFLFVIYTDDDCYDTYYDDTDPFQDDNNNNYTTNVNTNDPEQFEYIVHKLNDIQARFEPTAFSSSYIQTSSTPATCSICLSTQTNFQSIVCNHAFCNDCWTHYIDTKFQYQSSISKLSY